MLVLIPSTREPTTLSYDPELLGVSPSRVSEYLNGKSDPTLKVDKLLHQKLDIDPDIILVSCQ